MNVTCPECRSMFRVDPSKVPTAGVRARCSICGGIITVGAGTSIDEEFDEGAATPARATVTVAERETDVAAEPWRSTGAQPSAAPGASPELTAHSVDAQSLDVDLEAEPKAFNRDALFAQESGLSGAAEETTIWAEETVSFAQDEEWREASSEETPAAMDAAIAAPSSSEERAEEPSTDQASGTFSTSAASVSKPEDVSEPADQASAAPPAAKPVAAPVTGGGFPPTPSSPPSRPMFSRPPLTPPASSMAIPRSAGPVMPPLPAMPPARPPFAARPSSGTGPLAAARPSSVTGPASGTGPLAVPPSVPRQEAATPASSQTPAQSGSSRTPRTPINPFLANDPNAKARRLSRALISDLVTYFPQRRDEGLRNGTLKDLFRDEIKKSFEEYIDQVGRDFANSTTHFQDALNDILAAGKKLF